MAQIKRYKLYKAKKQWVLAAATTVAGLGLLVGSPQTTIHADSQNDSSVNSTTQISDKNTAPMAAASSDKIAPSATSTASSDTPSSSSKPATTTENSTTKDSTAQADDSTSSSATSATLIKEDQPVISKETTVSDPAYYQHYNWVDPDKTHLTFDQTAVSDGSIIVLSTDKSGDGVVYVNEVVAPGTVTATYKLAQNQTIISDKFQFIYLNGEYSIYLNNNNHYGPNAHMIANGNWSDAYSWVPRLNTETINYVDENGHALATPTDLSGMSYQEYAAAPKTISGYTLDTTKLPANMTGDLSEFHKGWSWVTNMGGGISVTYTQIDDQGDMTATVTDQNLHLGTGTTTKTYNLPVGSAYQEYDGLSPEGWGRPVYLQNPFFAGNGAITYVYQQDIPPYVPTNPDTPVTPETPTVTPAQPGKPTNPSKTPKAPRTPNDPGLTPKDRQPRQPKPLGAVQGPVSASSRSNKPSNGQQIGHPYANRTLPQTNDKQSSTLAILGMALTGIIALIGVRLFHKRNS